MTNAGVGGGILLLLLGLLIGVVVGVVLIAYGHVALGLAALAVTVAGGIYYGQ